MKKIFYFFLLIFSFSLSFAQTAFWTETFGNAPAGSCNQGQFANGFNSGLGAWIVTYLSGYAPTPNSGNDQWFVSSTESNPGLGSCSVGCPTATNRSLHLGSEFTTLFSPCPTGDCGAAYATNFMSDLRAESPVINATGQTNYTLSFSYIMFGEPGAGGDFGDVYYKIGAGAWTFLGAPPITTCGNPPGCAAVPCTGIQQGIWTNYSVAMPAAANNQAAVQIGFRWRNNGNLSGGDPSFAIDDVRLLAPSSYTPVFTLTNPACTGAAQTVTCTTNPATVTVAGYTWTSAPAGPVFSAPNASVTSITFPSTGTFSITVTTSVTGQGLATTTHTVAVNTTPTITASASPTLICAGGSSTLTANGATTYAWSGPSLSTTTGSITVASPNALTVYTVTGTTAGCSGTATVQVDYLAGLTLTVTPTSSSVCPGGNTTITASGATNYVWSPGSSLNTTSGAVVIASPTVATNYTVVGTNTNGCSGTQVVPISVGASLPIGVTPASATICPSGSAQLVASGATNYTWSPAGSLSTNVGTTVTAFPNATTTYTVLGATGTCTGSTTVKVTVQTPTNPVVSLSSQTTCVGGTPVTMQVTGMFTNYIWTPTVSIFPTSGAYVVASPSTTTQYTVLGSAGTCTGQSVVTVTVNPPGTLTLSPTTNTVICYGTSYTFAATGALTYTWSAPTSSAQVFVQPVDTNYQTVVLNPTVTTIYTITAQTAQGCLQIPNSVTVNVVPVPTATVALNTGAVGVNSICAVNSTTVLPNTATLTVNTSALPSGVGNFIYQWTPTVGLNPTSGTVSVVYPTMNRCDDDYLRTYTATVFYENLPGCKAQDTSTIRVVNCYTPTASFKIIPSATDTLCEKQCAVLVSTTCGGKPHSIHWSVPGAVPDTVSSYFPVTVCFPVAPFNYSVTMTVNTPYGSDIEIKNRYIHVVDTPDAVRASAHPLAVRDTCIRYGKQIQLQSLFLGPNTYVEWSPKTSLDHPYSFTPIASPTVTTVYVLTAYNSKKCKYNDTLVVCVDPDCGEMYVPNAFSPNNDGKNDILYVRGKCLTNMLFQVFNRWGEKVFESHDQEHGWDGTFNGEIMNTGVFVFRLEGTTFDNEPYSLKGNVTLIR